MCAQPHLMILILSISISQPVSIEVGQTRAGHQVSQVAVVCCEVVVSWTLIFILMRENMLRKKDN